MASRRLQHVLSSLTPPAEPIGTLTIGDITYDVPATAAPARLPHSEDALLDLSDPVNLENVQFLLQKYLLGQDVFLVGQPGPYARRLVMTFCRLINSEYEHIALHRDIGETELKQGREIRVGGNLVYVDSAAVRAVKHGRVLVIEGVEKAERGIMPLLNNLLENRELNLDDGTHIIHPHRYALLDTPSPLSSSTAKPDAVKFVPAHTRFRVIALGAPVPPYPGYPLDPPFRSRFQARFVDPVGAMMALAAPRHPDTDSPSSSEPFSPARIVTPALSEGDGGLYEKLRQVIIATQYASEARTSLDSSARSTLPAFPQTALAKLRALLDTFPVPASAALSPVLLARVVLAIHPALTHAPFVAWALLSRQLEEVGVGALGSPAGNQDDSADYEGAGLLGYTLLKVERAGERTARLTFASPSGAHLIVSAPAGPRTFFSYPFLPQDTETLGFLPTPRFTGLLTSVLQAHALGYDVSLVPPALPGASCSTSTLMRIFARVLGYESEEWGMYKELGGRELVMRRVVQEGGATRWEPSLLVEAAWAGKMVRLDGLDTLGSTAGSLARLTQDRECELWEGRRIVQSASEEELRKDGLSVAHPSFRMIATASKSQPLTDWLNAEHANMFFTLPLLPMPRAEERAILSQTGCPLSAINALLEFADRYRARFTGGESASSSTVHTQKNRKLGTRALVRICKRVARAREGEDEDLRVLLERAVLKEFLPRTEAMCLEELLEECGIPRKSPPFNPPPVVSKDGITFPASTSSSPGSESLLETQKATFVPAFDPAQDLEGVQTHVPHMDHFYDNSLQTGLMRDMAVDLEMASIQGVGKNKIIDRSLLRRPREYIQLHRDTTVNQLMFTTVLSQGTIEYTDSPLLRAITHGRIMVVDEADKAAEHVVAIFRGLAGHGQLTLADGRRVRRQKEREGDLVVHPGFRLILLANRPGYPFLGNHFLQVLGDNFSCHAVMNPDLHSEMRLLSQLAPDLKEDMIIQLINIVRHMQTYPSDPLEATLRNIFDFDVYKPETITKLGEILDHHGLMVKRLGLDAARDTAQQKVLDVKFEPKGRTDVSSPKFGKVDPQDKPHTGGNTWAGGVSDTLKNDVPDHVKEKAREMARQELARRLEELDMKVSEAKGYGALLSAVESHVATLHDLLENLAAREEERVWVKRQTDGELDDSRLTEGLTGEATVYKRRGMAKPELGRPQIKPKRIRFVFDISASMYRFQYDGRLQRSMETGNYSGDSPVIPLVESDKLPTEIRDRWKVAEKMELVTQYAFAGDYTVEAIDKAVNEVAKFDAEDLHRVMTRQPKVHTALICIGEGAEALWIPKKLQGRGFRVTNTADIPVVLRSILATMVDR
ncbi:AAA domain-containing protein [Fomitopsis serialis]|uniref:AAA domain-containing protein n=1 Tax=Fomitopsis serialis TaxID=139415 RepID=UPI002007718D|nr:AAA domain-containing protein [Neoantrodia serialis]KAH9931510.1 AAA domain-containing protein [Neoantrodia serialis]